MGGPPSTNPEVGEDQRSTPVIKDKFCLIGKEEQIDKGIGNTILSKWEKEEGRDQRSDLARSIGSSRYLDEAIVEGEIVSERVLPPLSIRPIEGKLNNIISFLEIGRADICLLWVVFFFIHFM